MDNDFIQAVEQTIAIINGSFQLNFLPNSRKLIEADLLQQKLFEASDRLKSGDTSNDALFVHLKSFGQLDDPCHWFIYKTYHPSEVEPEASLTMTRMYELLVELPLIGYAEKYLIRCHWALHLPKDDNQIDYALVYQWILKLNDDRTEVEGKLNYFRGEPIDTAATYQLAEV